MQHVNFKLPSIAQLPLMALQRLKPIYILHLLFPVEGLTSINLTEHYETP